MVKLAQAIAHAHARGVLHRDLKPGNVIMEPIPAGTAERRDHDGLDCVPRVTDFGLARLSTTGQEATAATQTGAILGTPSYMAPEQAQGGGAEVGPAADVYGLGAILYALLVGRPPFQADSVLDTLLLLRTQDPAAPSRLRPRVPRDLENRLPEMSVQGAAPAICDGGRAGRRPGPVSCGPARACAGSARLVG